MTGSTGVRRALPRDAAGIVLCLDALGYVSPCSDVVCRLQALIDSDLDEVFVCEKDEGIVGMASLHTIPLLHRPGYLVRITSLAVRPGFQRQGHGRRLLGAIENWSLAHGVSRVEVTSGDHRPLAHRFYEMAGYAAEERRFMKHLNAMT
ncbi:GNAT family N-acetyltransferase [Luteibacter aegosomatis]|uniref:GNAT family N-acetyltransferase n=1 Tax=Luteibacter aegosomatis TaxID=2911537 RepID=UPI001FF8A876|nr:GNAT family N-acetyltransferase [Luteibacter aegosomatis]UPG86800.1 GNAT family N-acetyltransferase [Luteibacter aegosomatis]